MFDNLAQCKVAFKIFCTPGDVNKTEAYFSQCFWYVSSHKSEVIEVLMTSCWYRIVNMVSSVVLKRYHTENMVWWIVLYNM